MNGIVIDKKFFDLVGFYPIVSNQLFLISRERLYSKTNMICGTVQILGGGGRTVREYFGWSLIVVDYGTKVSGYI